MLKHKHNAEGQTLWNVESIVCEQQIRYDTIYVLSMPLVFIDDVAQLVSVYSMEVSFKRLVEQAVST